MSPIEAAAEAAIPREWGSVTPTPGDYDTARRVIRAFLEAAAEDANVREAAFRAYMKFDLKQGNKAAMGAAILALKGTVNG